MNRSRRAGLRPLIIVFVIVNALCISGRKWMARYGIDADVAIIGNLLLFVVSAASFVLTKRSIDAANPQAFVRAMYGSFLIKFFVCAIAAFIYIMVMKKDVSKPALFLCMGFYLVYTFIEVSLLTTLLKQRKNA